MTRQQSVLRANRNFRLLYFGQAISQLGDWFNSVAVYALLLDLTGSATAVFGQRIFPIAGTSAAGIGVLYGARDIGARLGPIALPWILGRKPATLRRSIGPAYFIVGGFYVALAAASGLPTAALCVLCAHFGGSILWVFSTVPLQMEVPDRFRGRVFAAELALVTLTSSISSYLTAVGLDRAGWSPRTLSFTLGVMFCIPGFLWLLRLSRWRPSTDPPEPPSPNPSVEEEVLEGRIG